MLGKVSDVLDINPNDLKRAMASDLDKTLDNYLTYSQTNNIVEEVKVHTEPKTQETGVAEIQESEVRPDWKRVG